MERERDEALDRAIEAAGGPAELARFITEHYEPITAQAICDWKRCPPKRVAAVVHATTLAGKPITRQELRPDIFQDQAA